MTPRSLKKDLDNSCRYIPVRDDETMDVVRHVVVNGVNGTGGELGKENPDAEANAPPPSPAIGVADEFRRRMRGALLKVPMPHANPSTQSSVDLGEEENVDSSNTQRLLSFTTRQRGRPGHGSGVVDPTDHDNIHVLSKNRGYGGDGTEGGGGKVKVGRHIASAPSRILDAPELVDDYYLNLISWSSENILAVALGQCVYLWNADNGNIDHLLTLEGQDDYVTSVEWAEGQGCGHYVAVGTNNAEVQLWDSRELKLVRTMNGHSQRVGSLAWNKNWLSSGGRDSLIIQHDVRSANHLVATYTGHQQEVCGLSWNEDGSALASGGNENYLCLWDASMSQRRNNHSTSAVSPRLTLNQHCAAVKALAWCPHHRGLLASGGGTADRTIKFWNTNSGAVLNSIDTGSQVCSLLWSKHNKELASSHGFSENQICLWNYPTMTKIAELKGHTARVLHMAQSPDGASVVSAAADETLRFWNIFGKPPSSKRNKGVLGGSSGFGFGGSIR
ncbi:hypothetical protein TL16_g10108 [Triparma laevis f. inornata]|uniref:CDC20/Fizzy WD40 domain-containing protein n=2 Tax=Triparma laevis TaxID=1534972 RepID=A0A9W7FAY2_9STRA|nr:hypothetical protein TL16_g10108 [Triparma laevis f. inornata]GMI08224.1 hypothetical protein TrLO_g383 [Triparma laevis f. longispina]